MRQEREGSALRDLADRIASLLRNGNLKQAREEIVSAMAAFADAPEPHNLLGIYYEQEGDLQSARKHYRAAYALDYGRHRQTGLYGRIKGQPGDPRFADWFAGASERLRSAS